MNNPKQIVKKDVDVVLETGIIPVVFRVVGLGSEIFFELCVNGS